MRTLNVLALALGLVLAAAACQSTAPPAADPDPVSEAAYPPVVAQGDLHDKLVYAKATVERTASGAMRVNVPVRSLLQKDVRAQYRFVFLDDRGQPVRPEMDWQYKQLPSRTQVFLEGVAMQPDAVDWRLEVRPAR